MPKLKIIECPRDAMQSIKKFIPTEKKIKYIQSLLDVGFNTIDVGSFVSKKVIHPNDVLHKNRISNLQTVFNYNLNLSFIKKD